MINIHKKTYRYSDHHLNSKPFSNEQVKVRYSDVTAIQMFTIQILTVLCFIDNPVEGSLNSEGVFEPISQPSKDISSIINIRLKAMQRLTDNPDDAVALKELYDAQLEMSTWAASKNKPGQFTGHTGAKVLSKGELTTGVQAWAKSEQFTKASKVCQFLNYFFSKFCK